MFLLSDIIPLLPVSRLLSDFVWIFSHPVQIAQVTFSRNPDDGGL